MKFRNWNIHCCLFDRECLGHYWKYGSYMGLYFNNAVDPAKSRHWSVLGTNKIGEWRGGKFWADPSVTRDQKNRAVQYGAVRNRPNYKKYTPNNYLDKSKVPRELGEDS